MDIALKQRLVGAGVLIALAVIVLPMLLGGRPEGTMAESQKIELPPQPAELKFETRRFPVGESPQGRTETPVEAQPTRPLPAPGKQVEAPTEAEPAVEVPVQETPAPEAAAPTEPPPLPQSLPDPPVGAASRYVVQVASFGSMENANRLSSRLEALGYSVLLDSIRASTGTLHRVRVGPYPDRAAAASAVSRIQEQVGNVKPTVIDLQPPAAAEATEAAEMPDPLARWVVQLGSFSNAANAAKLVERLRQDSLSAYQEELTSSGSTIYRVRVGPYLEKEEAQRIRQRVSQQISIDGVVMSLD
jgi:DedD protein